MNKFLFSVCIGGVVVAVLSCFWYTFVIDFFFLLILLSVIIIGVRLIVILYEDPEKQKKEIADSIFYRNKSEESKKAGAIYSYNSAKKSYPVLTLIFSAIYIGMCVYRIVNRSEIHYFTLVLGSLLTISMISLTALYIHKKRRLVAKENIRTYAYIYYNFLIGLMLIAR